MQIVSGKERKIKNWIKNEFALNQHEKLEWKNSK